MRNPSPNDPAVEIALRRRVRLILSALPKGKGRGLSKESLRVKLEAMGIEISTNEPNELDVAIEWNHERNFVDFKSNAFEVDEWFLTAKGKDKA